MLIDCHVDLLPPGHPWITARRFRTMPVVFAHALFLELTQVFGSFFDPRYILKESPNAGPIAPGGP